MGLAEKWQLRDAVESAPAHPALPCITCTGDRMRAETEEPGTRLDPRVNARPG